MIAVSKVPLANWLRIMALCRLIVCIDVTITPNIGWLIAKVNAV